VDLVAAVGQKVNQVAILEWVHKVQVVAEQVGDSQADFQVSAEKVSIVVVVVAVPAEQEVQEVNMGLD
jgi:hypothetical protein